MAKMTAASRRFIDNTILAESKAGRNSIVLIGDSITEYNESTGATATDLPGRGFFTKLNILMYQRFNVVNYAGIGGQDTGQYLARFDADVIAYQPDYVWIFSTANDPGNGLTAAQSWANIKAMIGKAQAAGIIPIVSTTLPRSVVVTPVVTGLTTAGMTARTQAETQAIVDVNASIVNESVNVGGFYLIDWAQVFLADDTIANSTTGLPKSLYTTDGVHPGSLGARVLAEFAYSMLDPVIPNTSARLCHNLNVARSLGDKNNAVVNGYMLGTGGSASAPSSGNIADGWRLVNEGGTIQGVGSKVARTDGISGELQRVVVSGTGAVTEILRMDQTSPILLSTLGWVAGDTIMFEAEVFVHTISGGVVTHTGLELAFSGVTLAVRAQRYIPSQDTTDAQISAGVLRTLPIVIPAGATHVLPQLEMATEVGVTATFDWARVRCWKAS